MRITGRFAVWPKISGRKIRPDHRKSECDAGHVDRVASCGTSGVVFAPLGHFPRDRRRDQGVTDDKRILVNVERGRRRISLGRLVGRHNRYLVHVEPDGTIILTPATVSGVPDVPGADEPDQKTS